MEKPLQEGAFFFARTMLFPSLDKRNMRDKAKGLCITSERSIGELGVRCLSTIKGAGPAAIVSSLSIEAKLRALIAAPHPSIYIRHAPRWIGRSQRGAYIVRKGRKRGRSLPRGELKSSLRQPRRRREALGQASLRPAHAGAPAARAHASRER